MCELTYEKVEAMRKLKPKKRLVTRISELFQKVYRWVYPDGISGMKPPEDEAL